MVTTPLTSGYIYVIDWAPPSNDADDIDLDGEDPGTAYAYMPIPVRWVDRISTLKEPKDYPGGGNYIKALGKHDEQVQVTGLITDASLSNVMGYTSYWTELVATKMEDDGDLYLVIKYGGGLYHKFYDTDNETLREYCRGTFIGNDCVVRWLRSNPWMCEVNIGWKASW